MPINPVPYRAEIASRYPVSPDGSVASTSKNFPGHAIAWAADKDGYPTVCLYLSGRGRNVCVHRLVALFYLPPRPSPRHEIRHIDGNRQNPAASNLAWGTQKENAADREAHGRTARGPRHAMFGNKRFRGAGSKSAKLTSDAATEIRRLAERGVYQRDIAKSFGVAQSTVWRAIHRVTYFCIAASLFSFVAHADQYRETPDNQLTPGEVASTDVSDVCGIVDGLSYSKRHRLSQNPETKRLVLQRYGVSWADRASVEDDHNVPLCAGGSDSVLNRWPQWRYGVTWNAGDKDLLEAETCRDICSGRVTLADGQARFLAPALWTTSYCVAFPVDPRCPR